MHENFMKLAEFNDSMNNVLNMHELTYTVWRENFGGCKLWRNGKESIIGGINFGGLMTKV